MARVGWSSAHVLLGLVFAAAVAVLIAHTQFDVGPRTLTGATVVVGTALLVGSVALPALLFSRWQRAERDR